MRFRAQAILLVTRPHAETACVARLLTAEHGQVAAYVAGGRGRRLRPVVIPGNLVAADVAARSENQLPFASLELIESRAPWLAEPLPAAAIGWITALAAASLPERSPYPRVHAALDGLLAAICNSGGARDWAGALLDYEALLLRELGYGGGDRDWRAAPPGEALKAFERAGEPIARHLLAGRSGDVMAARDRLAAGLRRIVGE